MTDQTRHFLRSSFNSVANSEQTFLMKFVVSFFYSLPPSLASLYLYIFFFFLVLSLPILSLSLLYLSLPLSLLSFFYLFLFHCLSLSLLGRFQSICDLYILV